MAQLKELDDVQELNSLSRKPILSIFDDGEEFYIPEMRTVFSMEKSVHLEAIEEPLKSWCASFVSDAAQQDLLEQSQFALAGAVIYPKCADKKHLLTISKFMAWMFLADDGIDVPESDAELIAVCYKRIMEGKPFQGIVTSKKLWQQLCMFEALWQELLAGMNDAQRDRILKANMKDAFDKTTIQSDWLANNVVPNVQTYVWLRRSTAAVKPLLLLIDYVRGVELESRLLENPDIQKLLTYGIDHVMLLNDVFSFKKEWAVKDYFNVVPVTAYQDGCSLQEAVNKTCKMLENIEQEYFDLTQKTESNAELIVKPGVKEYIEGIGSWMVGNFHWSWETARYHGLGWKSPAKKCGRFKIKGIGNEFGGRKLNRLPVASFSSRSKGMKLSCVQCVVLRMVRV